MDSMDAANLASSYNADELGEEENTVFVGDGEDPICRLCCGNEEENEEKNEEENEEVQEEEKEKKENEPVVNDKGGKEED